MLLKLIKQFVLSLVFLARPVPVEVGIHAAKLVRGALAVVLFQVVVNFGQHVSVALTGAHRGEQVGRRLLGHSPTQQPHGHNDREKVHDHEGDGLLRALEPHGVEMHVELGGEVAVEHRVDILQVVPPRVLVERVRLGVRSVPTSPPAASRQSRRGEDGRDGLGAPHELSHQGSALLHLI